MEEWQEFMRSRWSTEPDEVMIPAPKRPVVVLILTSPISALEFAGMETDGKVH